MRMHLDTDETISAQESISRDEEFADEPTQPIPYETLAEFSGRWMASLTNEEQALPTCERPTRNIRLPKKETP